VNLLAFLSIGIRIELGRTAPVDLKVVGFSS